jgi:archaellum component FlaC
MKQTKKSKTVLRGRSAGIMIEDFDAKLDLIVEKVESLDQKVERLDKKVDGLEANMNLRFDQVDARFRQVESRLDRIEAEIVGIRVLLGKHDEILKRYDQDIESLKRALQH